MDTHPREALMPWMRIKRRSKRLVGRKVWSVMIQTLAFAAASLGMGASRIEAQVTWDFSVGTGSPSSIASGLSGGVLTASHLGSGALGFNNTSASNQAGASGGNNAAVQAAAGVFSASTSTYFEFTLNAAPGLTPAASSFSIGNRSTASGPTRLQLYSSADAFSAPLATVSVTPDGVWRTVALSGFAVTGTAGGALTFRLFGSDGTSAATGNWRIDDLALNAMAADPPRIVTSPANQTVAAFSPVTFSVTATAAGGSLAYQWRKNGTAISGATNATLTFAAAHFSDAGTYDVVVTNLVGTVTSSVATLVITKATAVITLSNLTATYDTLGHRASAATAPPGLTVDITYAGSASLPIAAGSYALAATIVDTDYEGSTTGTFVISRAGQTITFAPPDHTTADPPSLLTASATSGLAVSFVLLSGPATLNGATLTLSGATGGIALRATQSGNSNYQPAVDVDRTVQVLAAFSAPVITSQPAAVNAFVGDTVALTTSATGIPSPHFQWQKNGATIPNAEQPTLSIATAVVGDSGTYVCIVTNAAGSAVTLPCAVLIAKRPQTISFVVPAPSYSAGAAITLNGSASSGLPLLFSIVAGSGTLSGKILVGTGGDVVVRAQQNGDATYASAAPVERTFSIIAGGLQPYFTSVPEDRTVFPGDALTFRAGAIGTPAPTYQWSKDGNVISGATSNALNIGPVTLADAGRYTVAAANPLGVVTSSALLVVRAPATAPTTAVPPAESRRLVNLSARALVTPEAPLIAGFVIGGSGSQRVLLRAVGPSLEGPPFNVPEAADHLRLSVFRGAKEIMSNDDWLRGPEAAQMAEVAVTVGAFPLSIEHRDAALLVTLEPGAYTLQASSATGGVALLEVYDATP
jgi:hypothetical protein